MTKNHHCYVVGLLLSLEPPRLEMILPFDKHIGHMDNSMRGNSIPSLEQDYAGELWPFVDLHLY